MKHEIKKIRRDEDSEYEDMPMSEDELIEEETETEEMDEDMYS